MKKMHASQRQNTISRKNCVSSGFFSVGYFLHERIGPGSRPDVQMSYLACLYSDQRYTGTCQHYAADILNKVTAEQSNGPSLDSSQRHCRVFNHCQGHRRRDGQSAHHGRSHSCTQPIVLLPHPAVDLRVTWVKLGLRSQLDLSPKRLESRLCNQLDLKFSWLKSATCTITIIIVYM